MNSSRRASLYLYVVPGLLMVVAVSLFPLLYTLVVSVQRYILSDPLNRGFIGLENYIDLLGSAQAIAAAQNTLVYTVASVTASLVLGMALALLVNQIGIGRSIFRTGFFLPMMLAPAVVGVMWKFLFNDIVGLIPITARALGYSGGWLGDPTMAMAAVVVVDVWQWTPFVFMILLAGLEAMPQEPIESARVEGASSWQVFRFVIVPALRPLIAIALLFRFMWAFRSFDQIYTMTLGGPGGATELLSVQVWRNAFMNVNFGQAGALAIFMIALLCVSSIAIFVTVRTER